MASKVFGPADDNLYSTINGTGVAHNAAYGMGIKPVQGQYTTQPTAAGVQYAPDPYAGQRFQPQQGGYGTQAPTGFDQVSPGTGEQWFQQNEPGWGERGETEQHWSQVAGRFNGGAARADQQNQGQLERVTGRAQDIAGMGDAGLDPYYAKQRQELTNTMDRAAAARGNFGSSRTMDMFGDAQARLGAEQANREFDARLDAYGEARGWEGLGSDILHRGSDTDRGYLMDGATTAAAADQTKMARINAGMEAAMLAQTAFEGRGNRAADEMYRNETFWAPLLAAAYGDQFETDERLMDAAMAAEVGGNKEALSQDQAKTEKFMKETDWGLDKAQSGMSMMGGGVLGG